MKVSRNDLARYAGRLTDVMAFNEVKFNENLWENIGRLDPKFGNYWITIARRLFDTNTTGFSISYEEPGFHRSPLLISLGDFNDKAFFVIDCDELIVGYEKIVKDIAGNLVQRFEMGNSNLVSVIMELQRLRRI